MRKDLQWERPDVMDIVDPEGKICDPAKSRMFPCPDANWIKETWIYLKEKYRVVSKRWVKQTGGGGKELYDFPKYCTIKGQSFSWMTFVYFIDCKADSILLSHFSGCPSQLANTEAGCETLNLDIPLAIDGTNSLRTDSMSLSDRSSHVKMKLKK